MKTQGNMPREGQKNREKWHKTAPSGRFEREKVSAPQPGERYLPTRCQSCRYFEQEVNAGTPCGAGAGIVGVICFVDPKHPMWRARSRAQRAKGVDKAHVF